jgi:hypothetical protein
VAGGALAGAPSPDGAPDLLGSCTLLMPPTLTSAEVEVGWCMGWRGGLPAGALTCTCSWSASSCSCCTCSVQHV